MNDRNKYFVYFILGLVGFSSLLITDAYANFEVRETYQGTATFGSMSSESWLEWTISSNSGSESGRTDSVFAIPQLSFNLMDNTLIDIISITVIGVMDQSEIGSNYCFTTPNWNFNDVIKVNGITYDIGDKLLQQDTEGNPIFKGSGLEFNPSVVERLLQLQGVTLKDGDIIQWQVTADNRFDLWDGTHKVDDSRIVANTPSGFAKFTDGKGTCFVQEVPTQVADNSFLVDRPVFHQIFFTTGMKFSVDMTWVDIAVQTISLNPTSDDLDGDGIPDNVDLCTFTAENYNGFEDSDGCPDTIPLTPEQQETVDEELDDDEIIIINEDGELEIVENIDTDNDGFPNDIDFCPNQPENFNGIQDFDGCPDGILIDDSNFEDNEGNPIVFDEETTFPIISTDDGQVFDFIAENTDTFNPTVIVLETSTGIETDNGVSDECNPIFQNCNVVIAQAIQQVEEATGIKLPFEPSILNLAIVFGVIGIIIFMIGKATKKI